MFQKYSIHSFKKYMIKKLRFLFILLPLAGFSQNAQALREQAEAYYKKGDFLKSYQTLNSIKDKSVLENTTVNLQKANLEDIINHRFFKKVKLNDSLYKVYVKTKVLKSQGIYNEKSNTYTIPPIYDSIPFNERYFKYLNVYKNKQTAFVNIETGKVIIPLGNQSSIFYGEYILSGTMTKYSGFSFDGLVSVFDLDGNLLFKDLNGYNYMYHPNYIRTKNKNNKYQIFEIKTKKIIIDDVDYFFNPNGAIVENEIVYDNIWLPFHKNNQYYLYKITPEGIIDTHKFDTYIPLYSNFNYFDNAITTLINSKANAPFILDEKRASFFNYYTLVKKNDKYGIYNVSKNNYYKEPIYDSINKLGNTFYNGKWINLIYGEEICAPESDRPEGIVFKKNNLFGLMNLSGTIIAEADYDEIRFLSNGVFILRKGQKWGFIGVEKQDKLVLPEYDYIEYVSSDFGNIACHKNKRTIKYFRNGEKIDLVTIENQKFKKYKYLEEPNFSNNVSDLERLDEFDRVIFEKKGKYGLDDFSNKEILEAKYSNIAYGRKNTYIVSIGKLSGLIDHNGKEIIPVKYDRIERGDYNSGLLFATLNNGLASIFNSKGEMLYPSKIKEVTDYYYNPKTKTCFVYVTEISTAVNVKNKQGKKEEIYKNGIIKIKDDKAERLNIEGDSFEFVNPNHIIGKDERTGKIYFYNLKNGKIIEHPFNYYFINDYSNHRIFAKKDYYYDTVIDSLGNESTLEHPFDVISNGNYFFREGNNTGVMNINLEAAPFRYPVLKNINESDFQQMSPYPSKEYREKASCYFKFNPKSSTIKNGLINFDGTVIFQSGIYDDIQLLHFGKMNYYSSFGENEFLKKYENDLFVCTIDKKEYKTIQLITSKKEITAEFDIERNGYWNFSNYNNAIIIKSADSVKVYDLKNKKYQLKIKTNRFEEDKDSGYTISYIDQKTAKVKYEKYDYNGKPISDTIVDVKKQYYAKPNENYIVKRNDKYGTVNSKGKPGIPFVYDYLESNNGKLFISKSDNLFGIIDGDNQTIVDKKYQEINWVEIKDRNSDYRTAFSGYKVKEKDKFGLLDANSRTTLPTVFDELKLSRTIITAKKDSLISVYDYTFEENFSAIADSIDLDNNNMYHLYKNGKLFYRDYNGNITDKNPYRLWEDQLKTTYSKEIEGKYYLVKNNNLLYKTPVVSFAELEQSRDFIGEHFDHLLIQDENNFYGLFTKDLKQILPFLYEEINIVINEDFYIVKKAGRYGAINSKNQTLIPFEYDKIYFNRGVFYCTKNKIIYHITPQIK